MRRGKFERAKSLMERLRPMTRSLIAIMLCMILPVSVLAAVTADVSLGDVSIGDTQVTHTVTAGEAPVTQDHGGSVTVTGSSDTNTVTVTAGSTEAPANVHVEIQTTEGGNTNVVLDNANIEVPQDMYNPGAALEITGGGDATIELNGSNTLISGTNSAGLQISDGSNVTIQDETGDNGSLAANGATGGAGIGSGCNGTGGNIIITGGNVTASTSGDGAGIGSGLCASVGDITITGGVVNATGGGNFGAGIGSGDCGFSGDIAISGGTITATGGDYSAGIGNSYEGNVDNEISIEISGDADVTAQGGVAAIGGTEASGEVTVDTSKLTAQGSINGVAGTYAPPAPPAPPVVEEPAPVVPAAPAPEVIEEVKLVKAPVVKEAEAPQTVIVQGEEVQVTLNSTTVKVDVPEVVVTEESGKPTSLELVITVAPEAVTTDSDKLDATSTETVAAALKELIKEIKVEYVSNGKRTTVATNEYTVHLEPDGTITLELTEKLMQKLGKGIHEFIITIGGMEIVFSIEIK